MQLPIEISFNNIDRSAAVEELIHKKAAKLEQQYPDITSCHVYLDRPHQRKEQCFAVRVEVRVPGDQLAARTKENNHAEYTDINIALRDAFTAVKSKLAKRKQKFAHRRHSALIDSEE